MLPAAETSAASARRQRLSASALVAAAALGPLLIGSVVYGHRAVSRISQAVLRGEAEAWTRQVGSRLREQTNPAVTPTPTTLATMLEDGHPDGLRYIGFISGDSRVEAGTPAAPFAVGELRSGEVVWTGPLVRHAISFRFGRGPRPGGPPRRPGESRGDREPRGPGEPPRGEADQHPIGGPRPPLGLLPMPPLAGVPPWAAGSEPPRPPRPTWLVVEFEPRAFGELTRTWRTTLALSSATALAVWVLALWVWRSTRRLLSIEREAARARHLAALGEMSAVLAHEIRNPLTSLKGHSQLLVESLASLGLDKPRGKAERVVGEALRLEQITNDLLDFVKQGELHRTPTELGPLVRASVSALVPPEQLRLRLPDESVIVPVDATKLRQLIDNLVQNALQVGGGPVEVTLAEQDEQVRLEVRDHGPGIPPGQEERIFEPFVTTRVRGTGLGLAIARRIADRHGGTLIASNHPEGGALFALTLPRS